MTLTHNVVALLPVLLVISGALSAQVVETADGTVQHAAIARIQASDVAVKHQGLDMVRSMRPEHVGRELRQVLFQELRREAQLVSRRYWAPRRGVPIEPLQDPEYITQLAGVVADLRDADAIPGLAQALGIGFVTINALTDFGQDAAPAVLAVVMSPGSTHYAIDDGLITLRLMVERQAANPLRADTLARIRHAARHHLTIKQPFAGTTLWAIDLAAALEDPELRKIVEAIASSPAEARARGAEDPDDILQAQMRANDRLAGVPALPRPR